MSNLIKVIVGSLLFAFGLCLGLGFLILGCALSSNWWPLFSFIPFMFSPFPEVLGKLIISPRVNFEDDPDQVSGFEHFASFTTSLLICIGFGINIVLYHVNVINGTQFAFEIVGSIIVLVALFAFYGALQCTTKSESEY